MCQYGEMCIDRREGTRAGELQLLRSSPEGSEHTNYCRVPACRLAAGSHFLDFVGRKIKKKLHVFFFW